MRTRFLFFVLMLPVSLIAQLPDMSKLHGFKARHIGPGAMSGRVTSIAVVESQPWIIYAGTASGGLWRSESGGVTWKSIFDDGAIQNIGAVAVQQSNPAVIWAGTGEGNPRNSQSSGAGIFKSIDGGKTWTCMGLKETRTIHRIIIHRDNPDIVYVASLGSAWGPNPDRGVFKTTDGGLTWQKILYADENTGCAELIIDPSNPNKLIAAMWDYRRQPWFFRSGGKGSGLYVSFDAGKTWSKRTSKDGLPDGELGRIGLAVSNSKPNVLYALIEAKTTALYRSEDGGFSFRKVTEDNIGNRPFYYAEIYVDPQNENRLYNVYSEVTKSEDGGRTFRTVLPYSGIHPDHHAFWINPENPLHIIDGNDGGLAITYDGGKNWRYAENIPVGQFYHVNYDDAIPYRVYGGLQDNGSWIGPSSVWEYGPIRNQHWQEVLYGDGFDMAVDSKNPDWIYAMYQGGNLYRVDRKTLKTTFIRPSSAKGERLRFNWNAALAVDPLEKGTLYYGSQYVHKSTDGGNNWTIISPDLTTNDTAKQKQAISGGLTIDATNAENHTTILCIAPSAAEKGVIWAGTDDGNVQLSRDGGKTWSNRISAIPGAPKNAWVPQIVPGSNGGTAYVVINNYRQNDWNPYLYRTTDYGKTWTRIADEKKVKGHVWCVAEDAGGALLFMGTEQGLWVSTDAGNNWVRWNRNIPAVSVSDLKIHPRENDLILSTFGRGVYIIDNIEPLRIQALKKEIIPSKNVTVYPIPDAYAGIWHQPAGVRSTGDAEWEGENKPFGAMISFWLNIQPDSLKKLGKEKPKITGYIYNSKGEKIRTHRFTVDSVGFNRIYWNLVRDGVHFPSWQAPPEKEDLPGNRGVLPGTYRVVLEYQGNRDSAMVNVLPDPHIPFDKTVAESRERMMDSLAGMIRRTSDYFSRLRNVRSSLKLVETAMTNLPDSVQSRLKREMRKLNDTASAIMTMVLEPEGFKAIDDITKRVIDRFYEAMGYMDGDNQMPGENAWDAIRLADRVSAAFMARAKSYLDGEYLTWKRKTENMKFPLFSE